MKRNRKQSSATKPGEVWQKTQYSNLLRYVPSGTYSARIRVGGKLIRRSLESTVLSVAKLKLPSQNQFHALVQEICRVPYGPGLASADLVEFLAYGGFRKNEAAHVTWADCDFDKGEIDCFTLARSQGWRRAGDEGLRAFAGLALGEHGPEGDFH